MRTQTAHSAPTNASAAGIASGEKTRSMGRTYIVGLLLELDAAGQIWDDNLGRKNGGGAARALNGCRLLPGSLRAVLDMLPAARILS